MSSLNPSKEKGELTETDQIETAIKKPMPSSASWVRSVEQQDGQFQTASGTLSWQCKSMLCKTCLDYSKLGDQVAVGIVGGMPNIIEAMQKVGKMISI